MNQALLDELIEWLRIPSVSTGEPDREGLERAATWAAERVRAAGGTAELVRIEGGNPLVVGELRAVREDAPTVLIYGHYDVQGPEPLDGWASPPFEPTIRGGRLYARGAADDKGNFYPLLRVACELARAGELPVHVRVLIEGEEEVGGNSVAAWLRQDERGADVAIVFDGGMADADTPAITVGLRGIVQLNVVVRVGQRDLHSGMYGGSVLNALHVVHDMIAAVRPGPDGRVREELRAGIEEPPVAELESWKRLKPGAEVLAEVGGRPLDANAARDYYPRNGADASLDVNHVEAGAPRTVVPAEARMTLSLRLAPRQRLEEIEPVLVKLLRDAAPPGAEVEMSGHHGEPALFDVESPALQLAKRALDRATGMQTAFVRTGGSIPVVADMAAAGIPAIVSGFTLPDDAFHAPNESYELRSLELGEAAARELLRALADLPTGGA
ncbi:MAG TPA: M20/M25/M40 family metallo-hydrolase [Solirubrobacteraceae bacterium]|nr:M20/M25/M40 family metallo-hydrolase [Solirubrobacteraceae bacterium]